MQISVSTNAGDVSKSFRLLMRDQLPFALKIAVNDTAIDFQEAQREHMESFFNVRNPRFVPRAAKIKPWATKQDPVATVSLSPPGGDRSSDILAKFEEQTEKLPQFGSRLAVPTEHMPRTATGRIPAKWRIKNLRLRQHSKGDATFSSVFRGRKKTFAIFTAGGRGVLLERDEDDLTPLYIFVPSVPLTPGLRFFQTAEEVVEKRFPLNFSKAFDKAIRSAR